jgi:hypothetical protein
MADKGPATDREAIEYCDPIPTDLAEVVANEPLPLGECELIVDDGSRSASGVGRVFTRWTPRPAFVCRVQFEKDLPGLDHLLGGDPNKNLSVRIGPSSAVGRVRRRSRAGDQSCVDIEILGIELVGEGSAREVRFELVNMDRVYGRPVQYEEHSWGADRIRLESERWTVDLDGLRDDRQIYEALRQDGGFAVTHRGRAVRNDDNPITAEDARELFAVVQFALSFAARRWITPVRCRGFDGQGSHVWDMWGLWNTDPWSMPLAWFAGSTESELSQIFRAIDDRWDDQYWERLLRTSFHYHLEATRGLVNRQIIMGASLLELVGWHVVVEDRRLLSANGYDRVDASDRLRILMGLMGLSTEIPSRLSGLTRFAKARWDAAAALTEIRHSVVHAKRHRASWEIDDGAWEDGTSLNQLLCDLAMLYLLSYDGTFVNPLRARYAADAHPVPWAAGDGLPRQLDMRPFTR